jgi:hypothetical protein
MNPARRSTPHFDRQDEGDPRFEKRLHRDDRDQYAATARCSITCTWAISWVGPADQMFFKPTRKETKTTLPAVSFKE